MFLSEEGGLPPLDPKAYVFVNEVRNQEQIT